MESQLEGPSEGTLHLSPPIPTTKGVSLGRRGWTEPLQRTWDNYEQIGFCSFRNMTGPQRRNHSLLNQDRNVRLSHSFRMRQE